MVRPDQTSTARSAKELEGLLGVKFKDIANLEAALYHRSFLNEAPEDVESNERLEFLGDAVLGLIISDKLYQDYPAMTEGQLSQVRAILVRWDALAQAAERISLGEFLILGKGEEMSGGRERPSNLAGGYEAVIGAAFIDSGMDFAREMVLRLLKPDIDEIHNSGFTVDSKSELQHLAQTNYHEIPQYTLISSEGPDHAKLFTVEVSVGDQVLGRGQGRNKKQAESNAARQALETLAATGS